VRGKATKKLDRVVTGSPPLLDDGVSSIIVQILVMNIV
jgi:hypothetical protein